MKSKANMTKMGAGIFYKYIYPVYSREFLLGNDYEVFIKKVEETFILNSSQYKLILSEWELKEQILS